jgi:hypothetical protein
MGSLIVLKVYPWSIMTRPVQSDIDRFWWPLGGAKAPSVGPVGQSCHGPLNSMKDDLPSGTLTVCY